MVKFKQTLNLMSACQNLVPIIEGIVYRGRIAEKEVAGKGKEIDYRYQLKFNKTDQHLKRAPFIFLC